MAEPGIPVWPLLATLAVQTLATMALYSVPALAPAIAADLAVNGTLVGGFVAIAYGVGIGSALLSPGLIRRYGGVRATQAVLLAAAGMLVIAATSSHPLGFGLAAMVLGCAYGAAAPASTHLLAHRTPRAAFNLVMSLRQIGVPLGGVAAALLLPPLVPLQVPLAGWRCALLLQLAPIFLLILVMERARPVWDADRDPLVSAWGRTLLRPFALLRDARLRVLSGACFVYSGLQLCFVAFMTVHLTAVAGMSLVQAGLMLAAYQVTGSVSRPIWGWIADRFVSPSRTLALHGAGMAVASVCMGLVGPGWAPGVILAVVVGAGVSAGGYTGVAYAEFASLGGGLRTEATGLGTALMFAGGLLIPPLFGAAVLGFGGYDVPYRVMAGLALLASAGMGWPRPANGSEADDRIGG